MFASRAIDTIPIPGEPGQTATIRALTGGETDAAQEAHLRAMIAGRWSAHGWAAQFTQQLAKGTATAADAARVLADPLNGYDRLTIVNAGLLGWSITDPALPPPPQVSDPPTKETTTAAAATTAARARVIADLVDDALEYYAREILRRTKPALFLTKEDAKALEKELPAAVSVP